MSKARADGDTDWASVDSVIEHDATINPANSGGPLVTAASKVVAVTPGVIATASQDLARTEDAASFLDRLSQGFEGHRRRRRPTPPPWPRAS